MNEFDTDSPGEDLSGRSSLLRNVVVSWASQFLVIITGFFLPRVLDEQLGQATVGIWDFSWSLVSYLTLTQFGVASSLSRFVANYRAEGDNERLVTAVSTVTVLQIALSGLILLVVGCLYFAIPWFAGDKLGEQVEVARVTFALLGSSIAVQFMFDTSRGVLTGTHRWDLYTGLYSGAQLVAVILMIGSVYQGYGLTAVAAVYFVAIAVENLIRFFVARRICPEARFRRGAFSWTFLREIFTFGIKGFTMGMAPVLVIQTTSVMIASLLGPAALAIFSRPSSLIRYVQTFVTRFAFMLTPMVGPILLEEGGEGLRKFTVECSRFGMAFTLPVVALFSLFGDEVIYVWMGEDYMNSALVTILGLGFLLPFAQAPTTRILVGMDKHGVPAVFSVAASAILLILGSSLIYQTGPTLEKFALMIVTITTFINGLVIPAYACIKMDLPIGRYCREAYSRVITICAAPLAAVWLLDTYFQFRSWTIIVPCGIFLVLVVAGYWKWLLSDGHREMLLDRIRGTDADAKVW